MNMKPQDNYSFPYWSASNRVVGQPKQLSLKYESTYGRVVDQLIAGRLYTQPISLMGLFATNWFTIQDYIDFKFRTNSLKPLSVESCVLVERDSKICYKIAAEEDNNKNNLQILNYKLRDLVSTKRTDSSMDIFRRNNLYKFNFIDADFMHNWGYEKELDYLPGLINLYAAKTSVIHINAISYYPRTIHLARKRSEIEEILNRTVLSKLHGSISQLNFKTYNTCTRAPTEMTSAVFTVQNG